LNDSHCAAGSEKSIRLRTYDWGPYFPLFTGAHACPGQVATPVILASGTCFWLLSSRHCSLKALHAFRLRTLDTVAQFEHVPGVWSFPDMWISKLQEYHKVRSGHGSPPFVVSNCCPAFFKKPRTRIGHRLSFAFQTHPSDCFNLHQRSSCNGHEASHHHLGICWHCKDISCTASLKNSHGFVWKSGSFPIATGILCVYIYISHVCINNVYVHYIFIYIYLYCVHIPYTSHYKICAKFDRARMLAMSSHSEGRWTTFMSRSWEMFHDAWGNWITQWEYDGYNGDTAINMNYPLVV